MKIRVAVFFGGRSPEHDVSIVTGLQAIEALDQDRFSPFPVYVAPDGKWLTGDGLRQRSNYLLNETITKSLEAVTLDLWPSVDGRGRLLAVKSGLFSKPKPIEFDVALLAFHGLFGEDGRMQALFELANVPYTGMRTLASSVLMDKAITKRVLRDSGIALLDDAVIARPPSGLLPSLADVEKQIAHLAFPVIVKPVHLGSSIGVAKAANPEEIRAGLSVIFRLDTHAVVEPFVENLVEYNVAVRRESVALQDATKTGILTSAVERPKTQGELLDFKQKYMSGSAASKSGGKQPGAISQGMLSLTRELNPPLDSVLEEKIRSWSGKCFELIYGTGAPRIDFLCNRETGGIWLNEVNPCPGSFGYFLWEAAQQPILFAELLTTLIDEAFAAQRLIQLPPDPTHPDARLFPRP